MKDFFDKLETLFKPTHQISAGEDIVDTLIFFAIMALLLFSVL
jgi:hypothetical protein